MSVKFCPSLAMCKKIMLQKKLQQLLRMSLDSQTAFQISKDVMMAPLGSDGFMDSEDFAAEGHSEKRCFSAKT